MCKVLLTVLLSAVSIYRCTMPNAGVETTNGVTIVASANKIEGITPPFSGVYLFNRDYIPFIDSGTGLGTTTGSEGGFRFTIEPTASYNIAVVSADARTSALFSVSRSYTSDDNVPLLRPAAITGSVSAAINGPILVILKGTGYYHLLSSPQTFTFESVPSGTHNLQVFVLATAQGEKRIVKEGTPKIIVVLPGALYDAGVLVVE